MIVTPDDYARWTAAQPQGDDLAHQGEALFRSLGCSGCHTPGSTRARARPARRLRPRWCISPTGAPSRPTRPICAIAFCCRTRTSSPGFPPIMPNFTGDATEGQLVELLAYLKSLTTGHDERRARQHREPP